ncbi:unnamed protein product [Phytophthora lilii]|uniref:Unnamed protein product n=1 Tax=Phytophthora lilii TaxID=2077276 RepID=A0A9W6X320_9STRA|nr:unnamed protein product [Phytophthora lilii]
MCLRLIVKLVAVALLAGVAPTLANGKTMVGAVDGLTTHKGIALHNRMLRRVNDEEEERANWMTSLVTKFKDSRKVSAWVKQDLPSNQVLGLLKLHQTDKILEKPQFKLLESFVTKYNTKNHKNKLTVLDILTEKFGVDGVAKMLVSAKNVKSTETLAARMQGSQIAYYMRDDRNVNTFFTP